MQSVKFFNPIDNTLCCWVSAWQKVPVFTKTRYLRILYIFDPRNGSHGDKNGRSFVLFSDDPMHRGDGESGAGAVSANEHNV